MKTTMSLGLLLGFSVFAFESLAQEPKGPTDVESLMQRIDDIEKKRRAEPQASLTAAVAAVPKPGESTSHGFELALWALGVAATIFAVAFAVRQYRGPQPDFDTSKALEIEESMWVGRGQRLLLVRVRDSELLIGATGGQLTSLAVFSAESEEPQAKTEDVVITDDASRGVGRRREAEKFASLVQEELTNATAGSLPRNKQQILRRLNNL